MRVSNHPNHVRGLLLLLAGTLLKYYTSERDVGRNYRGVLALEVRRTCCVCLDSAAAATAAHKTAAGVQVLRCQVWLPR